MVVGNRIRAIVRKISKNEYYNGNLKYSKIFYENYKKLIMVVKIIDYGIM